MRVFFTTQCKDLSAFISRRSRSKCSRVKKPLTSFDVQEGHRCIQVVQNIGFHILKKNKQTEIESLSLVEKVFTSLADFSNKLTAWTQATIDLCLMLLLALKGSFGLLTLD